jgi:Leucine-rich repeat (LRR) protein
MSSLEYLGLHMNGFFGSLQKEISKMKSLKVLNLFGNYFGGTIPKELADMKHLVMIDLYANQFEGTIPSELGQLKKLRYFDAHDNNLVGSVPKELCKLKLDELIVDCLGPRPEVKCDCCTVCCSGLPEFKCVDQKTGKEIKLKETSSKSS